MRLRLLLPLVSLVVLVALYGVGKGLAFWLLSLLLLPVFLIVLVILFVWNLRRRLKRQLKAMHAEFGAHAEQVAQQARHAEARRQGNVIDTDAVRIKE